MPLAAPPPVTRTQCTYEAWYQFRLAQLEYEQWAYERIPAARAAFDLADYQQTTLEDEAADLADQLEEAHTTLDEYRDTLKDAAKAYAVKVAEANVELKKCDPRQFLDEVAAIYAAAKALKIYRAELKGLRADWQVLEAEETNLTALRDYYQSLESDDLIREQDAWCVDLTEDGSGEVATIEVPGEDQHVLIAAGCRAPENTDGQLIGRTVQTPAQVYFNAAVLPGWQRWQPEYRIGEIVDIDYDADTASVFLDDAVSSAPHKAVKEWGDPGVATGFDVNLDAGHTPSGVSPWQLDDVPVDTWTATPLHSTSRTGSSSPAHDRAGRPRKNPAAIAWTIIGFAEHPKPCPVPLSGFYPIYIRQAGTCADINTVFGAPAVFPGFSDGVQCLGKFRFPRCSVF